tara:strand:- start:179 stop:604 length:426 start_codon:yes stop_codon:yes gene_type:complete
MKNYLLQKSLILFETIFLFCGVYFPLARIDEFWLFSSEFSILSLTRDLFINGEILLSIIIIIFGFIFPFIKIIYKVFNIEFIENLNLHKFSMVDIFLLSFIVFAGKTSNYFEIHLLVGFYFLLISVLINYSYIILYKFLNY